MKDIIGFLFMLILFSQTANSQVSSQQMHSVDPIIDNGNLTLKMYRNTGWLLSMKTFGE